MLVVLVWATPAESQLRTFYVDAGGNDSAAGSSAAPWRTLQRAANGVQAGDLVIVRPGTYTGFYPFDEHEAWRRSAARLRRMTKGRKDG